MGDDALLLAESAEMLYNKNIALSKAASVLAAQREDGAIKRHDYFNEFEKKYQALFSSQ